MMKGQLKMGRQMLNRLLLLCGMAIVASTSAACLSGVGDACTTDEECGLDAVCLTDDDGFPGGYCTIEDCDEVGCDLFSECFGLDIGGDNRVVCLEFCDINLECERDDYACFDIDGVNVCLPDDGVGSDQVPAGSIGSGCRDDLECDESLCLTNFRGGYCSAECNSDSDCPSGSHCEDFGCLQDCSDNNECRSGYTCSSVFSDGDLEEASCVPDEGLVVKNPDGDDDGEPCASDINCKGGTCLRAGTGHPGGYCTTLGCDGDDECNGGLCVVDGTADGVCRSECDADSDCRDGYRCATDGSDGFCLPENGGGSVTVSEFEIECTNSDTLQFDIPSGSQGFYIAPFTDGQEIVPQSLKGPQIDLDLVRDFNFYSLNPQLLVSITPLQFPGSDLSRFGGNIDDWGGSYELEVSTSAREVCFYVIPSQQAGTRLDVNFYLVGVDGVSASSADSNRDIDEMVTAVRRIYSKMNIDIGTVRFNELSSGDERRFSVIRDFNEIFELVTRSKDPGSSADELLSVNVFLIDDFQISQAPGLLGVSLGLPGAQGIHGTTGTGLIFSSVNLSANPSSLGQTMAHEIGHFLGLRHTTEHGGDSHDPIRDTPQCDDPEQGSRCPDASNFMFPFSLGGSTRQEDVSDGQEFVLRRSGLVK